MRELFTLSEFLRRSSERDRAANDALDPNPAAVSAITKFCQQEGVLVLSAGTYGNVLRFLPPLVMPEDLLLEALEIIEKALASLA